MPSAKEIDSKDKINLREMQVKLLEKTEEITLYILQLKKENEKVDSK